MRIALLGQSLLAVCAWVAVATPSALTAITNAVLTREFMAVPGLLA